MIFQWISGARNIISVGLKANSNGCIENNFEICLYIEMPVYYIYTKYKYVCLIMHFVFVCAYFYTRKVGSAGNTSAKSSKVKFFSGN